MAEKLIDEKKWRYYYTHFSEYNGLTEKELKQKDPEFYDILVKQKKLHEIICVEKKTEKQEEKKKSQDLDEITIEGYVDEAPFYAHQSSPYGWKRCVSFGIRVQNVIFSNEPFCTVTCKCKVICDERLQVRKGDKIRIKEPRHFWDARLDYFTLYYAAVLDDEGDILAEYNLDSLRLNKNL